MDGWTHEKYAQRLEAQVRDLQSALRDVLEISEVEGAVNLTTIEYAKVLAARDLVPKKYVCLSCKQRRDSAHVHFCNVTVCECECKNRLSSGP